MNCAAGPSVNVTIPVLNEVEQLERSVTSLVHFLAKRLALPWEVVIADNGSTDGTEAVGQALARRWREVAYVRLAQRGRGRALRQVWSTTNADICSYMDVDLSTNLESFPALIRVIAEDGYDVAIGSRLIRGARIVRSVKREVLSRAYNGLVKTLFWNRFSDGQCGFKAIRTSIARQLIPLTRNETWFFDTELLLLAERYGYTIKEIPVAWIEDLDTRVQILRTAWEDVRGLLRLRLTPRQPLSLLEREDAVASAAGRLSGDPS